MDFSTTENGRQEISLLESLNSAWIKLPFEIMRDVGPAVQTLGALLKVTDKETYIAVGEIARCTGLPIGTVRKHLVTLDASGWIANRGREHTHRGRPRRTATIAITKQTKEKIEPYGAFPWWACCSMRKRDRRPVETESSRIGKLIVRIGKVQNGEQNRHSRPSPSNGPMGRGRRLERRQDQRASRPRHEAGGGEGRGLATAGGAVPAAAPGPSRTSLTTTSGTTRTTSLTTRTTRSGPTRSGTEPQYGSGSQTPRVSVIGTHRFTN